jgi:Protein of unknown function (DUF3307)
MYELTSFLPGSLTAQDTLLLAIAYLAFKHMIADFFLQTKYQWSNKGRYGHSGGLLHAAIHTVLSAPVLLILPPASIEFGAAVLAAEYVVHYHCDWTKEQVVKANKWTFTNDAFWRAMGVDQLVHGLTYVAMVRALA